MCIPSWRSMRSIASVAVLMVAIGCTRLRGPEPTISSLAVTNRSLFDVNVYVMPSATGSPSRIGRDAFGDRSLSKLHTVLVADTIVSQR